MGDPTQTTHIARFADFELDLRSGELLRNGHKTILQEKPFKILTALLQRPGEMVTREELIQQLWPAGTFVDFNLGLNKAVTRLREALDDSADHPRLIGTIPKRGYRFIGVLNDHRCPNEGPSDRKVDSRESREAVSPRRGWLPLVFGGIVLAIAAGALFLSKSQTRHLSLALKQRQLTSNASENSVTGGTISPDGEFLAYADLKGIHVKLIETGEIRDVVPPESLRESQVDWGLVPNWVNRGTEFLANALPHGGLPSVWVVPVSGGAMRKVRDNAMAWTASRDGTWVPFGANLGKYYYRELWMMRPDGGQARKLFQSGENTSFVGAEFSPDGRRLAYVRWSQLADKYELSIESRDLGGGLPVTAVSIPFDLEDWTWAPDGRIITSFPDAADPSGHTCNFWQYRIDGRTGSPSQRASRLTDWSGFCMDQLSVTADGERLAFRRTSVQSGVLLADLQANGSRITPPRVLTPDEARNQLAAWTIDSRSVIFTSNRNGPREIYRQALDQDAPQLVATLLDEGPEPRGHALIDWLVPRVSPDGTWILYLAVPKKGGTATPVRLMRIPIAGGPPQLVLTTSLYSVHSLRCSRLPATLCVIAEQTSDRKRLVFTAFDPIRGRGRELAHFETEPSADAEYAWDLSPDGTRIAIVRRSEATVHVLPLGAQFSDQVVVKGWGSLQTVDWAAGGKAFFISAATKAGAALLRVNLKGDANLLWKSEGSIQPSVSPFMGGVSVPWAAPSPDGHRLAICRWSFNANMWMIQNF